MKELLTPPKSVQLREAPAARFDGPPHAFDLLDLSAHLLNEAHAGASGHRQTTIFRHEATTMVLFAFENGGQLPDHKADGRSASKRLEAPRSASKRLEAPRSASKRLEAPRSASKRLEAPRSASKRERASRKRCCARFCKHTS